MAEIIDFQTFRICTVFLLAVVCCLLSHSVIVNATDGTTTISATAATSTIAPDTNITYEGDPVFASERKRGPKINSMPWLHLKPQYSNLQISDDQATEVPIRQLAELAKIRVNQIAGTRHANKNMLKFAKRPKSRGPRVFQRNGNEYGSGKEDGNTFDPDAAAVAYPYQFVPMPDRVPNAMFRPRDGNFRSPGYAQSKTKKNQKDARIPMLPPHCQECFQSHFLMNPSDSYGRSEKFYSETPVHVAMPIVDRDSQNNEDIRKNTIEDKEDFGESSVSISEIPNPGEDLSNSNQLAIDKDLANIFNIKGNSNHFYFMLPNGSAASTINALKSGTETLRTQPLDSKCPGRCSQIQKSRDDNEIANQKDQIYLNCGCKTNKVVDPRSSLSNFGQQDQGQYPVTLQVKPTERQKAEKQESAMSAANMELSILPLLKLLQESQSKLRNGSNLLENTRKPTRTPIATTSQSEVSTESYEASDEEESYDEKAKAPNADGSRVKGNSPHFEKKTKTFEEFLSGKIL